MQFLLFKANIQEHIKETLSRSVTERQNEAEKEMVTIRVVLLYLLCH